MNENVATGILRDEAEALLIVEPLYSSTCQNSILLTEAIFKGVATPTRRITKKPQRQLQADAVSHGITTVLHCSHTDNNNKNIQRRHTTVNVPTAGESGAWFHAQKDKGPHLERCGPEIRHQINSLYSPTHMCAYRLHLYAQTIKLSGDREGSMRCSHLGSRLRPYGYENFTMSIPTAIEGCQFYVPAGSFV
jgi:hypothetical protein